MMHARTAQDEVAEILEARQIGDGGDAVMGQIHMLHAMIEQRIRAWRVTCRNSSAASTSSTSVSRLCGACTFSRCSNEASGANAGNIDLAERNMARTHW